MQDRDQQPTLNSQDGGYRRPSWILLAVLVVLAVALAEYRERERVFEERRLREATFFAALEVDDANTLRRVLESAPELANTVRRCGHRCHRGQNCGHPLLLALAHGRLEAAKVLVRYGSDLEVTTARRRLPIHFAAHYGDRELVELMMERKTPLIPPVTTLSIGRKPPASCYGGLRLPDDATPVELALEQGHDEVARLLDKPWTGFYRMVWP